MALLYVFNITLFYGSKAIKHEIQVSTKMSTIRLKYTDFGGF